MKRALTIAGVLALWLAGCSAPSLHPLSARESLVGDPGLVGEWATEGPTVTRVVVSQGTEGTYTGALTIHHHAELKAALALEIALTDIGKDRYADLYLAKSEREGLAAKYGFLAVPVHQFMMMRREGDTLRVWTFNADWIRSAGREEGFACEVLPLGGRDIAVITADSGSLRGFLGEHAQDGGALSPPMVFHRVDRVPRGTGPTARSGSRD